MAWIVGGIHVQYQFLVPGYNDVDDNINHTSIENNQREKSHYLDLLDLVLSVENIIEVIEGG
tara:strand:+ start:257 stop:442 length:186 start_codon:yes stop_codon:yes gene_type:complete